MVDEKASRYIEICTLFGSLFSLLRTPYGKMNDEKLKKIETNNYVKYDEVEKSRNVDAND